MFQTISPFMKKVNVLTKGFTSPNGCAFLFPLIKHRRALKENGIDIRFYTKEKPSLGDADVLIVDSKYFRKRWRTDTDGIISAFKQFRLTAEKIIYFDISDSTGWPHARILPYVDRYVKNQLLKDRSRYQAALYGHRPYTDYYHAHFGVADTNKSYSEPVAESSLLKKLTVGWSSGLADYSFLGPYRMKAYNRLRFSPILSFPRRYISPAPNRVFDVSCRMGLNYHRETVSWQRRQIRERLKKYVPTDKISRKKYYQEIASSKVVVSPFGLGEITLKDFEVFLTGGLLLKPDMTHLETWPDLFRHNETMMAHRWDLTDLEELITELVSNYPKYIDIARSGQNEYRRYLVSSKAPQLFCEHFLQIINS